MATSAFDYINANAAAGKADVTIRKELRIKGKTCPFTHIEKQTEYVDVTIGEDYVTKVREAQDASGATADFVVDKVWHKVYNQFFNVHKTNPSGYYLRAMTANAEGQTPSIRTTWYADGGVVEYEAVEPYLYANDKPKKRQDNGKQLREGVDQDKQVDYSLLSADNIISFAQNGKSWVK